MKTVVLGLFLGLTTLTNAQDRIAYVEIGDKIYQGRATTTITNLHYLNSFSSDILPERVKAVQNVVANYDIKESPLYTENPAVKYTVLFTEGKNTVRAVYDHTGSILECEEKFESVAVPYKVSLAVLKDHPGWAYDNVRCYIYYSGDSTTEVIYKATLKKGDEKKVIKIDALANL